MPTPRQANFLGGELAPEFYGRTDSPLYAVGARKLLNFIVRPSGALQNRPGTKFVASTKDQTQKAIQVPFVFSTTQTYVLEFGNLYIRFLQSGGQVVSAGIPYEIATPFTTAMLPYLEWDQVGDVMTLCYRGQAAGVAALAPRELKRFAHTNWTLSTLSVFHLGNVFGGGAALATVGNAQDATHPARPWMWCATELWREDATGNLFEGERGMLLPQLYNAGTTYAIADQIYYGANNEIFTSLAAGNIGHQPDTSPTFWVKGSVCYPGLPIRLNLAAGTKAGYTLIGWNIFRGSPDTTDWLLTTTKAYGWVGSADSAAAFFLDDKAPDYSWQPPHETDPFGNPANDFPATVAFFEQRRIFAGQVFHPQRISGSRTGQYSNFDVDLFVEADDAVSFDVASAQLDEIRSLVSLQAIFALTQSGVWTIRGFQGQALSPTSINARKQQHAVGASWVSPARVVDAIIYEQDGGGAIQEFVYDGFYDVGRGRDISTHASHFFEGHTVVRIVYSARPRKTIWIVRDDGVLLGLTYVRSQDPSQPGVLAWHQHTTDGVIEDACVVPEGTEDALYLAVKRTINGATVRYHERMQTRLVTDVRLGVFLDAALTFDGRNVGATTMKFTSGSTYAGGEEGTILASAASFVPDDVGSVIVLDPDALAGGPFRLTVLAFTDATHVTAQLDSAGLPTSLQNVATTSWGFARRRFFGLGHLEGKTVAALADGAVATAAKQDSSLVVTGGQIQIDTPAVIVHVGLPYNSDLELLDLATAKLNVKSITRAVLEVVGSRGLWAGETFAKLKEWRQRGVTDAWGNPPLAAGLADVSINASWNTGGRAVFRQVDPLPLTVVAAIREVTVGGTGP